MWEYYFNIVDYYIYTIDDMQNEKYFYGYCKMFVYNHDYVNKIDETLIHIYKYVY